MEILEHAIDYFSAHEGYFWRWAERGRVIEFANKKTICYREDLTFLLNGLPEKTKFPLGSMLLLLCACKDNCEGLFEVKQQLTRLAVADSFASANYLLAEQIKDDTLKFLRVVNSLPYEARSGLGRTALIGAVIDNLPVNHDLPLIHQMVKQLATGELDYKLWRNNKKLNFAILSRDLSPLAAALALFPDKESLELKLKTGLNALPGKAPLQLPEFDGPNLLGQLENDIKTRLLGGLARKIFAAIRIPMHLSGSSDQSLGGVADITNRGTYDKLLLSELAQDDALLTARLANNEALFLQRETTPDNAMQELGVFVDVTLKMWGLPRVLAIATGLAFREGRQKNQQLKVWAVGGLDSTLLDLDTKNGVITALELLDPSLNCAYQLIKTVTEQHHKKGKYTLITDEGFLHDAASSAAFHQVSDYLNFLVTVNRDGHIQLFKLGKGRKELLNLVLIDPYDDLFKKKKPGKLKLNHRGLPAIMQQEVFPLYFPASKIKFTPVNTYVTANKQILMVTRDNRLLYWPDEKHGAIELVEHLPGLFYFGETANRIYLLVKNNNGEPLTIYWIGPDETVINKCDVEAKQASGYTFIKFIDKCFYLSGRDGLDLLDPSTLKYLPRTSNDLNIFNAHLNIIPHYKNFNPLKKQINPGYSVINSVKNVYIHREGELFIDKRSLQVRNLNFHWYENTIDIPFSSQWIKPVKEERLEIEQLPNIKFTKFTWHDGSETIMDSRGLLYLKSADTSIPEVTILLIIDHPAACWSADGMVSGPSYFTGKTDAQQMGPPKFEYYYIKRFINSIK